MIKLPTLPFTSDKAQFIYAIIVIILVPGLIGANTIFLLNNANDNMSKELQNKAMVVESVIELQIKDKLNDQTALQKSLADIVKNVTEIRALEVFTVSENDLKPLFTTSDTTKEVFDPTINAIAWQNDHATVTPIYASISSGPTERIWVVASPIHDQNNKKIGLINAYVSAPQIDHLSERTTNLSLLILAGTMLIVLLLLVNHFRFFETSILFKKLRELDQLKDDFLSIASHELKTPLTSISGFSYILMKNPVINSDAKLSEQVYAIEQSAKRLSMLVEDILDVSRIEQNRLKMEFQDYDIREVVKSVVSELTPLANMKNLKLEYIMLSEPLIVNCDKNKMVQIMTNIIGNAVKYTFKGGVQVYHEIDKGFVKTYVKDTGIGMSEEERNRLFSKFYRAYNDKTKNVSGTGLGLWITKQLVEKMKGKISAESIQNQGSQFVITFPLKKTN